MKKIYIKPTIDIIIPEEDICNQYWQSGWHWDDPNNHHNWGDDQQGGWHWGNSKENSIWDIEENNN